MRDYFIRIYCVLSVCFTFCSCASGLRKNLEKTEILHHGFSGLAVYDVEANKKVFEFNADRYFTPASNTKILTLLTGIKILEDSIATFVYTEKQDSLIFSATGDPSLLNSKFPKSDALKFLKNSAKNLYYQPAQLDDTEYGPGWAWDDLDYSFSAPRSALPVYGNLAHFSFNSETKKIAAVPAIFQDSIRLRDKSGTRRIPETNRFITSTEIDNDFSKNIPFQTSENLSIQILENLIDREIEVINTNFELDRKIYSIPSDSLYREMMHQSDNFIAEQILLMSAAKLSDTLNSEIAIDHIQNTYLNRIQNKFYWVDGSGLSRYNLATPNSIVEVLKMIYAERSFEELKRIFPALGKDGTVKTLLKNEDTFVFAKSGSLRNNYSLSGFLISKKGKVMLFSFMNSNYTIASDKLKEEMEKLLLQIRNKY